MGSLIQLKRTLAGAVPGSLADGELLLDMLNGLMYWKDSGGTIRSTPLNAALANGLATLDGTGKLVAGQLPANVATTTALSSAVSTAVANLVNSAPSTLDTLGEIAAQLASDESAAAALTTAVGNRLRVDADQSLTTAQQAQARKNATVARADVAAELGLGTNPFMEFDQENTGAAIALTASNYAIDQVIVGKSGTMTATSQRVADPFSTVAGFRRLRNGLKITVGTAQASLSAGDYLLPYQQPIEGNFVRGLGFGAADASGTDKILVLMSSLAVTLPVAVQNGAKTRSYVTTITLAANVPTVLRVAVPPDTSGVWASDTSAGMIVTIGACAGTTRQASTLGAWQTGDYVSHASCTNWAATAGASITFGFVQLFPTGVMSFLNDAVLMDTLCSMRRAFNDESERCQRYYEIFSVSFQFVATASTQNGLASIRWIPKRVTPSLSRIGTPSFGLISADYVIADNNSSGYFGLTSNAAGNSYVLGRQVVANARM